MEFSPGNKIIRQCLQAMAMEEKGQVELAGDLLFVAWDEVTCDFERFYAAYYLARCQTTATNRMNWLQKALELALSVAGLSVGSALPTLYKQIADGYDQLGDEDSARKNREMAAGLEGQVKDIGPFYHGTRAEMQVGDLLTPRGSSNYQQGLIMNHIYFTGLVDGAGLAAALANGSGRQRVYIVEPTGDFENDPNVTDKKFPGNPTRSYRSRKPIKVVGEASDWQQVTPEVLQQWKEKLAENKGEIIN